MTIVQRLCMALVTSAGAGAAGAPPSMAELQKDLQNIVEDRARAYNCSFSIAVKAPGLGDTILTAATGDGSDADTRYAWGSITKMWTGSAVMQLVAQGVLSLDELAAPHADAQLAAMRAGPFPNMNFSSLSDLYGPEVNNVTIRNLLAMQSGIADFDTANPSRTGPDLDTFRATVYKNAKHDYDVPTLLSEPWVAVHKLVAPIGKGFSYSSTNFEILGLILAHHRGHADYRELNQSYFMPEAYAGANKEVRWARQGSPRDNGVIPGYDRTDYNGQDPKKNPVGVDVGDVHGVFAGWSAADFVAPPRAVAELSYGLWGKPSDFVPEKYRDLMVPTEHFYGLASQNVGDMGIAGPGVKAYGHLGATYGYDSIVGYGPDLDAAIAVATNIETSDQTQPADAYCRVYNRVKNYLKKEPTQNCTWTTQGYYGGVCKCTKIADVAPSTLVV